jgi:hypothetical protein
MPASHGSNNYLTTDRVTRSGPGRNPKMPPGRRWWTNPNSPKKIIEAILAKRAAGAPEK